MFWMVAAMVGLVAGVAGVKFLLNPASGLRLSVFRPWQGDPWPRGVQEEDGVRFDRSAAARLRRAALRPDWNDIMVAPSSSETTIDPDPIGIAFEELPGGAVVADQLDAVEIHRPRH
jgi:hypothetical protein